MSNNSVCEVPNKGLYTSGYSIILLLGLTLNVYAFVILRKFQSPTSIYIKNLIFSDLLLIFTLPLRIYYYYNWSPRQQVTVPPWLCKAAGTILLLNMYGSIFFLACISIDRCFAVCFPLSTRHVRQKAIWVCVFIWALNLSSCLFTVVGVKLTEDWNNTCFHSHPPFVTLLGPTVGALALGFLVPLLIIAVSSCALLRAISHSQSVQEGMVNKGKIVHMLLVNLSVFLICFLPYHIVILLYQFWNQSCKLSEAYKIALLMACCNAMLDPIVYYFATETFRRKNAVENVRLARDSDASTDRAK
ncbi:lysophosphatidic acid receptor 4-like [Bombina bombina]|uniref:lysophosphatidic acid receptor 4-like n=1 Tax=Bombina bombina TaxID=8345 RepID=UPI00235B2B52|nr:lysophosphatidic acid receptor 4-like [Bombina bombina]